MRDTSSTNYRELLQQSFVRLKDMQARLDAAEKARHEPIAIIGMGCRLPGGANSPEEYWQLLQEGRDAITEIPAERWDVDAFYDADHSTTGKMMTRWGGFLQQVDQFDAGFFGITAREAESMDPQQRLLLEVTEEALEDAGQTTDNLAGSKTGTFIGIHNQSGDYTLMQLAQPDAIGIYTGTGTAHDILSARLAYHWDLHGPSITINTACSSSLVAVHLACQSLRNKETDLALAGGVNLLLAPQFLIVTSKMHMLSPDGRCKTFDASADGIVMGEGCGVVVLKRLSDAQRDNDRILATIRGSAINQDGHSAGLTAPNVLSQKEVLTQALKDAGVKPDQLSYVETHGTGTSLGDPIELEALSSVVGARRSDDSTCVLGAVKTNIGHLAAAAGIASLIKVVLCIQHNQIPPNRNFSTLNPSITLDNTPFVLPHETQTWSAHAQGRYVGISAFGWGGTNAHLVLSDPPSLSPIEQEPTEGATTFLLPLSAQTPAALSQLAQAYLDFLHEPLQKTLKLRDLCYTASQRRLHYQQRLALNVKNRQDLEAALQAFVRQESHPNLVTGEQQTEPSTTVFVFNGQGAQWFGMARQLFQQEPAFRTVIEACDQLLSQYTSWSLIQELTQTDLASTHLHETAMAQPLLFSIQIALANLWRSWQIEPAAVIGHSVGEIAAAYVAGVLSLKDAVHLAFLRGRIMQQAHGHGRMMAIELTPDSAAQLLENYAGRVSIAALNGPQAVVLSGEEQSLLNIQQHLQEQDIFCRMMDGDYAFHSVQMEPYKSELMQSLGSLQVHPTNIPLISTVTGQQVLGPEMDAVYWAHNIRQPVLYAPALKTLCDLSYKHLTIIEIGPHPVLARATAQCLSTYEQPGIMIASLRRQEDEYRTLYRGLATLYVNGQNLAWKMFYPSHVRHVTLPHYPWQRQSYWLLRTASTSTQAGLQAFSPPLLEMQQLVGTQLNIPLREKIFVTQFERQSPSFLRDHKLYTIPVVSASTFLSMALAGIQQIQAQGPWCLENVDLITSLPLPEDITVQVQTVFYQAAEGQPIPWHIYSQHQAVESSAQPWQLHTSGVIGLPGAIAAEPMAALDLAALQQRCAVQRLGSEFYQEFRQRGYGHGDTFQWITRIWQGAGETLCRLELPASLDQTTTTIINPGLLDACIQALWLSLPAQYLPDGQKIQELFVPVAVEQIRVEVSTLPGKSLWCHARLQDASQLQHGRGCGDIALFDERGTLICRIQHMQLQRVPARVILHNHSQSTSVRHFYTPVWQVSTLKATASRNNAGRWLIFADSAGYGDSVAQQLIAQGEHCTIVKAGSDYEPGSVTQEWRIRPAEIVDWQRLFAEVNPENEHEYIGVVYMWSLDIPQMDMSWQSGANATHQFSLDSVICLLRHANIERWPGTPRLWLITSGAQTVEQEESAQLNLAQTPLVGLGRVIANEYPQLRCARIDLSSCPESSDIQLLTATLLSEKEEDEIAIRHTNRYTMRLQNSLPPAGPPSTAPQVQADGTYLITGGLGDLGMAIAQRFIEQGARNLILCGRQRPTPQKQQQLATLRQKARVEYFQVDVAQYDQLATLFESIKQPLPPLRGIVHTAGVIADSLLEHMDPSHMQAVLAPKIQGTWNLHLLTRTQALDFFVCFSSVAALLGTPAQGNYAAANAFMDAFAHFRHAQQLPALTINWGPWEDIGMAAATSDRGARLAQRGLLGLTPNEALVAMEHALHLRLTHIAIMNFDERRWRDYYPSPTSALATLLSTSQLPLQISLREQLQAIPQGEQRRLRLENYLQEQIAHVLHISPSLLDPQRPLGELPIGNDSLMLLEINNHLKTVLELKLSQTTLWNYPTIASLTEFIADKMGIAIQEEFDNQTDSAADQNPIFTIDDAADFSTYFPDIHALTDGDIYSLLSNHTTTKGGRDE